MVLQVRLLLTMAEKALSVGFQKVLMYTFTIQVLVLLPEVQQLLDIRKLITGSDKDEEFFVELRFSWVINEKEWNTKAPKAWEMNKRWNYSHRFRPTVISITQDMAKGIDDIAKEKGGIILN